MKYCQKCGKELIDEAVICTACGCAVENIAVATHVQEDKVSAGLCFLAFFIPLFGFIYWPVKHKETPKRARACGITAIVAWAINFISSFIIGFINGLSSVL